MGEQKKAYLISCSDHFGHRLHTADACLKEMGYECVYITSNFDHFSKSEFKCDVEGCVQLPAKPYKSNLSISRILSHRSFAKSVFQYIEQQDSEPGAIVALLPPNFLAYYAAKYKKKHKNVKLFFDIFDLWPETFPSGKVKKLLAPVFKIWANIRDKNLGAADFIFTECEMFRKKLGLLDKNSKTLYLCAEALPFVVEKAELLEEKIELCYLGSINNIISIPDICELIKKLAKKRPVTLHIIGAGEKQDEFVQSAKEAGATVEFYGAVYDEAKKHEIMSRCRFGLNIMKSSVCVGFTMKSLDYFRHGLPIINNIPADTEDLVKAKAVGVQLDEACDDRLLEMTTEECLKMRENVAKIFDENFKRDVVVAKQSEILKRFIDTSL